MTVKFYISKDTDGTPMPYRKPYENMAVLQVAKSMWRAYRDTQDIHFAVISNIQSPPIDLVIISTFGLGIIDFKHANSPVDGRHDTQWYYLDENGKRTGETMLAGTLSASRQNPYHQVQEYKDKVHRRIKAVANTTPFPSAKWLSEKFKLQGSIVFTSMRFDTSRIKLDLSSNSWFSFVWPTDIAAWAQQLSFDVGYNSKLPTKVIDRLAIEIFNVTEWNDISGHLNTRDPFAQLVPIIEGVEGIPYLVDQDETGLGRDPQNLLALPHFKGVSNFHAILYRTPDKKVYIRDNESTNGTYINQQRIDQSGALLHNGDIVILGKHSEGKVKEGSCAFKYSELDKNISQKTKFQSTGGDL